MCLFRMRHCSYDVMRARVACSNLLKLVWACRALRSAAAAAASSPHYWARPIACRQLRHPPPRRASFRADPAPGCERPAHPQSAPGRLRVQFVYAFIVCGSLLQPPSVLPYINVSIVIAFICPCYLLPWYAHCLWAVQVIDMYDIWSIALAF